MNEIIDNKIIEQIKSLLESARQKVAAEVNSTLIATYWQIGKIIVEDEQKHESRAEYGKQTLKMLSNVLTEEYGKGFFPFQFAEYAAVLSRLSKMPVSDWQIELDALLRTFAHFGRTKTQFLRERMPERALVGAGTQTADRQFAI